MEHHHKEKGAIDSLKPRAAFKAGLMTGIGVMFVIGFFILLGMMLSDKDWSKDTDKSDNGNVVKNVNDNNNAGSDIQLERVDKDNDWIMGNKNAKVSIVEFSDVDCPFCTRFHATTKQIVDDYDGDVNVVFRHFPLLSLHPEAQKKAEGAECAGELGGSDKFWEFIDKLFEGDETAAGLANIASSIGVNSVQFQECLDSGKYTAKVQDHAKQAQAAGGRGTPYSVIVAGDTLIPVAGALPIDTIKAQLDSVL